MKINAVRELVILGGGTSAWLSAAYFSHHFKNFKITVVDKEVGTPVGVGEGTLMNFGSFMKNCGFDVKEWMPEIDATYKSGILFPGWKDKDNTVWHPFLMNPQFDNGLSLHDVWSNHQQYDFKKYGLGVYDISITHNKIDTNFDYAYHVDASKVVSYIQKKIKDKITIIRSEMVEIIRNQETGFIQSLLLKNGSRVDGDFFIDCTGFKGLLNSHPIRNNLEGRLICDTAVAGHVPYKDRHNELHPYVISEAIECGWVWNIPVKNRIGSGLVFNRSVTDPEQALDIFCKYWDHRITKDKLKIIDWTPYYNDNIWHGNVAAIGLSAGFIEPLESTGIALIMEGIHQLAMRLADGSYNINDATIYNSIMKCFFEECIDFVSMHYSKTTRTEPFWQVVRDTIYTSEKQKYYIDYLQNPNLPMPQRGKDTNFFTGNNWSTWLIQMGYPVAKRNTGVDSDLLEKQMLKYYHNTEDQRHIWGVDHDVLIDRTEFLYNQYFKQS